MSGYISITDNEWCDNQKDNHLEYAVFWRKRLSFHAVEPGESFYFLRRSPINGERCIVGKATYVSSCEKEFDEAWDTYGCKLGILSYDNFEKKVFSIYKSQKAKLGCIVLKDLVFAETPIPLSECKIEFSPYIVSGKTVDGMACKMIDTFFEKEGKSNEI